MATTKRKLPRLPASLGAAIDGLWALQRRADLAEAAAKQLDQEVSAYKEAMLAKFKKSELNGAAGGRASVTVVAEDVPTVEDFMKLWRWARKYDAPELFQKRLSSTAVRERWEAGQKVPGVGVFHRVYLQCRARSGDGKKPRAPR